MLNMPIEEIRSNISLKEDYWEYDFDTNCYAFALGLDIGEYDICKNAYQPGVIYINATNKPISLLKNLSIYERIQLDLKTLKIGYSEIGKNECWHKHIGNYECIFWTILLFLNDNEFHFARYNYDGKLYEKIGYFGFPKETSIDNIENRGYKLVKKYTLRRWERY